MATGESVGAGGWVQFVDVHDQPAGLGAPEVRDPGLGVEARLALPAAGPGVARDTAQEGMAALGAKKTTLPSISPEWLGSRSR
ncbi:hypothetical protein ACIBI9_22600 [Nonomuraea sp. NPDC050451]|uniref:hypothetical protein n=1 Tax=Nonomuraea sp. NPDC050451 TaxID=3364364 RepID=UPI0037BB429C